MHVNSKLPKTREQRMVRFIEVRFPMASLDYRESWMRTFRRGDRALFDRADSQSVRILLECGVIDHRQIDEWTNE